MSDLVSPGAIAQLGERLLCKQEVTGSIPVGSTRANQRLQESGSPEPIIWTPAPCARLTKKFRAEKKEFLLIFDIVDRNATGCLGWLPCWAVGVARERASTAHHGTGIERPGG